MTGACIACGTPNPSIRSFRSGPYQLAACRRCGLGWILNPPTGDDLTELYSTGFYTPGPVRPSRLVDLVHGLNNAFRLRELGGMPPGRLLDVGSGRGRFLAAAQRHGWVGVGIELEPGLAAMARERYGVEVVVGDAATARVEGPFDVVTIWHTLEHLPDPLSALTHARELLKSGGRLIVSVPNNDSWQARLGGDDWFHLDIPRHIYHFTPASLSMVVARCGFRVEGIGYMYPEMDFLGVLQTAVNRLGLDPDLLYRFAKRDPSVSSGRSVAASIAIAASLAPFAAAATIVAPLARKGASMQLRAVRARDT